MSSSPSPRPPHKRRRLSSPSSFSSLSHPSNSHLAPSLPSPPPIPLLSHHLCIFSWNINGITALIPSRLLSQQNSITSYFGTTRRAPKAKNLNPGSEEDEADDGIERERQATLYDRLERWKHPQIVCLQEVKIRPGDERTMETVREAVKTPTRKVLKAGSGSTMGSTQVKGKERQVEGGNSAGVDADMDAEEDQEGMGVERGYRAFFALPRDKYNARGFGGKVYGVAVLVREDLFKTSEGRGGGEKADERSSKAESKNGVGECNGAGSADGGRDLDGKSQAKEGGEGAVQVTPVPWDTEGRVLALSLPTHKLVVFNIYAVNGTSNPWRDSTTGHILGTRHDKKRAFHSELQAEVRGYEQKGWHVVVAGDLNIARSDLDGWPGRRHGTEHVVNRRDFEERFMKTEKGDLGMVDTFRESKGDTRKYSYRPRGVEWGRCADRVDLVLCSKDMRRAVLEADILDSEVERGTSDHCPIYLTVDLEGLEPKGGNGEDF